MPTVSASSFEERVERLEKKIDRLLTLVEASPGMRTVYVENHVGLVRLSGGLRLYIDTRDIGVGSNLMIKGAWEAEYTALLRRLVTAGMTCIDAGANFGYYSVVLGDLLRRAGRLYAFEPNPWLASLIQRSLKANGLRNKENFRIYNCALGAEEQEQELQFIEGDFGGGSLFAVADATSGAVSSRVVKVAPLDSFDIPTGAPIVAKIDTEGAEYTVLRGAENLFRNTADVFVMMEFTPAFIQKSLPVPDFIRFIRSMGFNIMLLRKGQLIKMGDAEIPGNGYIFMSKGNKLADLATHS